MRRKSKRPVLDVRGVSVMSLSRTQLRELAATVAQLSELQLGVAQLLADLAEERRRLSDRARRANRTRRAGLPDDMLPCDRECP